MSSPAPFGVRMAGVGSAVPDKRLTNADLEKIMDTSDEWIVQRTGIHERRVVDPSKEGTFTLSRDALQRALENAAHAGAAAEGVEPGLHLAPGGPQSRHDAGDRASPHGQGRLPPAGATSLRSVPPWHPEGSQLPSHDHEQLRPPLHLQPGSLPRPVAPPTARERLYLADLHAL